jgi:1-acyl-sn-glycerol-3-phosphate acyltransferase
LLVRVAFSLLFWTFFVVSCVPLFVGALVIFCLTTPFDRNGRILHLYSCGWAQLYFWVNPFWKLRVDGREKLPWHGAAVLVSNHESLGDILVLFGLFRPYKWVSKKSNFSLPFIGWNMALNRYVPLIRGQKTSVLQMMRDCQRWLSRGVPVLVFPEGTRSPDGEVKAFKDGAFQLAVDQQCPVIPIALSGTAAALPKHGLVLRQSVVCRVSVLDPVQPSAFGNDVSALREHVRATIIAARASLSAA